MQATNLMCSLPRCHEAATGEAAALGDISPQRCLCKGPFPLAASYNTDAPEEFNSRTKYSKINMTQNERNFSAP